jgi:hypothetical protein
MPYPTRLDFLKPSRLVTVMRRQVGPGNDHRSWEGTFHFQGKLFPLLVAAQAAQRSSSPGSTVP